MEGYEKELTPRERFDALQGELQVMRQDFHAYLRRVVVEREDDYDDGSNRLKKLIDEIFIITTTIEADDSDEDEEVVNFIDKLHHVARIAHEKILTLRDRNAWRQIDDLLTLGTKELKVIQNEYHESTSEFHDDIVAVTQSMTSLFESMADAAQKANDEPELDLR